MLKNRQLHSYEAVRFIETKQNGGCQGLQRGEWELLFDRVRVWVLQDGNVLDMDGDDHTAG